MFEKDPSWGADKDNAGRWTDKDVMAGTVPTQVTRMRAVVSRTSEGKCHNHGHMPFRSSSARAGSHGKHSSVSSGHAGASYSGTDLPWLILLGSVPLVVSLPQTWVLLGPVPLGISLPRATLVMLGPVPLGIGLLWAVLLGPVLLGTSLSWTKLMLRPGVELPQSRSILPGPSAVRIGSAGASSGNLQEPVYQEPSGASLPGTSSSQSTVNLQEPVYREPPGASLPGTSRSQSTGNLQEPVYREPPGASLPGTSRSQSTGNLQEPVYREPPGASLPGTSRSQSTGNLQEPVYREPPGASLPGTFRSQSMGNQTHSSDGASSSWKEATGSLISSPAGPVSCQFQDTVNNLSSAKSSENRTWGDQTLHWHST